MPYKVWFLTPIQLWHLRRSTLDPRSCLKPLPLSASNSSLMPTISKKILPSSLTKSSISISSARIVAFWPLSCQHTSLLPVHGPPWRLSVQHIYTFSHQAIADWACRKACSCFQLWKPWKCSLRESGSITAHGSACQIVPTNTSKWLVSRSSQYATPFSLPSSTY